MLPVSRYDRARPASACTLAGSPARISEYSSAAPAASPATSAASADLSSSLAERTAFSRIGVSCLHGPHHGAQKSTRTGCRRDSSSTSFLKACVVVSLTRPSAVAAATPTFIQVDLSCLRKSQEAPYSL